MSLEDAQQGTIHLYRERANTLEQFMVIMVSGEATDANGKHYARVFVPGSPEYERLADAIDKTIEHYRELADHLEEATKQLEALSVAAVTPLVVPAPNRAATHER